MHVNRGQQQIGNLKTTIVYVYNLSNRKSSIAYLCEEKRVTYVRWPPPIIIELNSLLVEIFIVFEGIRGNAYIQVYSRKGNNTPQKINISFQQNLKIIKCYYCTHENERQRIS